MVWLLRMLLNFVVAGALAGVLLATLVLPRFIVWNNTATMDALCNCRETSRQTADELIHGQMVGCGIGAGVGLAGGLAFAASRRKKAKAAAPPTATT